MVNIVGGRHYTHVLTLLVSLCFYMMGVGFTPSTHATGTGLRSCIPLSSLPMNTPSRLYKTHMIPTTRNDQSNLGVRQTAS